MEPEKKRLIGDDDLTSALAVHVRLRGRGHSHGSKEAVMECAVHDWRETGVRRRHVDGDIFKYGTPIVTYVRCERCGQIGYQKPGHRVVYTWAIGS